MAERLADGVWRLELGLVPPLASNAYLIDDGELTLVDAGLWWNRPSLRGELRAAGYGPDDLDRVLLTHYDLDHTGGLSQLGDRLPPVYIGEADARLAAAEWEPALLHHKGLFHRAARRLFPLPAADVQPVHDGDRIGKFTAFHAPGHNPGHTVYLHDGGVALLGDLVWEQDGELTTPIRFDSYDMAELRASVRDLAAHIEFDIACMGHGRPLADPAALADLAARLESGT
jgi:glyoxylase-like metal-dependent hydrolase (beta-lactamase superfamily II)